MSKQESDAESGKRGKAGADPRTVELPPLCRSVAERSPLPLVAVEGGTHTVRYVNPAFCRIAGKTSRELVGKAFAEAMPTGERTDCSAVFERVYRTGASESIAGDEDTPVCSQAVYWSYTIWPLLTLSGQTVGVIACVTDTTEAAFSRESDAKLNQEILEINEALVIAGVRESELADAAATSQQELFQAQKMEGIGRLAGGIAHDFNNLITAILGFTELAEETLQPEDEVQVYLHHIQEAAERAAALNSQLLAFARKQIIEPKIVDLNSLVLDIDTMLQRLIGAHIELTLLLQPDAGHIKIDPGQLGQVLMNLVVNARDAMPEGGKITIETANAMIYENADHPGEKSLLGDFVLLTVSDTGTGITEEMKAHLFEPFFTTKEQGKGTGLGLATCYGIVKQGGGHIHVTSVVGQGTTFHIYLPREADVVRPVQPTRVVAPPLATGTILLVEDERMVREIEAKILRRHGYTVFEAGNGTEALHWVEEYLGEIDLLITDVVMPLMGGRELADQLHITHPSIKVLFTSGYTDGAIVHQGMLNPGLAFLQKPFLAAALIQKVQEVLLNFQV